MQSGCQISLNTAGSSNSGKQWVVFLKFHYFEAANVLSLMEDLLVCFSICYDLKIGLSAAPVVLMCLPQLQIFDWTTGSSVARVDICPGSHSKLSEMVKVKENH